MCLSAAQGGNLCLFVSCCLRSATFNLGKASVSVLESGTDRVRPDPFNLLLGDTMEALLLLGALGLVFMKTVTRPLNIVSSSLAGVCADSPERTHPSCGWGMGGGCPIYQRGDCEAAASPPSSSVHSADRRTPVTRLDAPHTSPLHVNNRGVRLTGSGASCSATLRRRSRRPARRFHRSGSCRS